MKHALNLTKNSPVKGQILPEDFTSVLETVKGFLQDPMGMLQQQFSKDNTPQ